MEILQFRDNKGECENSRDDIKNFGIPAPGSAQSQNPEIQKISNILLYFTSIASFRSLSTRIRPQFSQMMIFLRCLISLCFCGGMALKQPPQASRSTGTTARPLR